ncbi:MAG: dipeptidase, partial [Acidobacteriota bacterium]
ISERTESGDFDYPRAREGGLDTAFMSIYVPAAYQETGGAKEYADRLIDMVEGFERDHPDKFAVARSVDEVRSLFGTAKIAFPMGMENGAPVEDELANLEHFQQRGIRYITLTHARANQICDSSYDSNRKWKGLSPFGRRVVEEMNRLGIMVDISHVSDEAFFQVVELTKAPVIASHSSCRHFTPGWERNMSDEMILRLAENGGVIQINFGADFINDDYRKAADLHRQAVQAHLQANNLEPTDPAARQYIREYRQQNPLQFPDVSEVADHIDHVRDLAGIDHVGLGSDFDGVQGSLPNGLRDVTMYPNLFAQLLKRGYTREDIEKIASGNLLRVWGEVERVARGGE